MTRIFLYTALVAGGLWGCSSARVPEVPITHPANVDAPQAGAATPSGLLEHHHTAPGSVEGRKLNRGGDSNRSMDGSTMSGMSENSMSGMEQGEMGQGDRMASPEDEATSAYTCTMHPEVKVAQQGYCPRCGMMLIPVKLEKGGMEGMDHGHQTPR